MTRHTSIDAYRKINESGLLQGRRLEVYNALYEAGPMTQVETVKFLQSKSRNITDHGFTPRFSELRDMGAIYEVQDRKCSVTGMTVIEWDVTDQLPSKPKKKLSEKELLKTRIAELEKQLANALYQIDQLKRESPQLSLF